MKREGRWATRRARWLGAFTALLLAVSSVPVLADPPAGEQAPVGDSEAGGEIDPSLLPDAGDLAKAEERVEEEEAQRALELESPAAVAEREESRSTYEDLESAEAVSALLRASFADELATLEQDPARVLTDATLKRSLGSDGGAVISEEGKTELMETEIPAEVPAENGELEKVDLSLEETADGFEPENPTTDVLIPTSPAEPVSLEGGEISITQVGVDPESDAHAFGEKDVIYPEVQTDTDLLVAPRSAGVELFDQLRSPASPETLRFELDISADAELRFNRGAAEVWRDGKMTAMVPPPHAVDAQGTLVPVTMEVVGTSLVLSVAHREGDFAYPILVDPDVQNNWSSQSWEAGYNYGPLEDNTFIDWNNNPGLKTSKWCLYKCWGSGRGLFVSFPTNGYGTNQQAQWAYFVKGETTYLTGYLINPFRRDDHGCSSGKYPEPHDFDGIWSPAYNTYYQLYTNRAPYGNASVYGNTAQSVKAMVFGLNSGNGVSLPCWRDIYAGGVATYMSDPENPTLDPISGYPTGWFDDSKTYGVSVSAHDPGLGVSNVRLNTGLPSVPLKGEDCEGTHDSPCPRDMSGTIAFDGDNFDEGKTEAKVVASDALLKASNVRSWTAYVDRTPPEVSLSGQLAEATKEEKGDGQDPEKWDELSLPVYNLKIEAEDGETGSDKKMRSGVKDIQVFLDEKEEAEDVPWEAQGCGGPSYSCPMTVTYPLELTGLKSGKHTLKVVALDQLGHERERDIEFTYIPATGIKDEYVMHYFPLPDGQGNESEEEHPVRPELAVNVMNGNLVYRQRDVDVEGPAADLEVERFYNSQLPESENTEWGDGWILAQTPELDPEEGAIPKEADLLDSSGTIEGDVQLPGEVGKTLFDPELKATLTKEAGGGYELADESGETESALAFDKAGKVQELRTDAFAEVDYDYEEGMLTEIAVEDPGSTSDTSEVAEAPFPDPEEAEEATTPEGLVAAYSFDEGGGWIAHDDSGNGHNGDLWEAAWTTEGKHGGALDFGSELSLVSVPDAAELDFAEEFTLEAWVRPDSFGERSPIFAKGYEPWESNYRLDAGPAEGPPLAGATDQNEEDATVEGTEALPPKAWSHLAITFDGEELRLYVDGEEAASEAAEGPWADGAELQIGGDFVNWAFFDGKIDDVRLYDRALDAEEIEADRDTAVEATRGLVAAYPFEDGPEEDTAHDLTGEHDGTIDGAEWTAEGKYGGALAFDGEDDLLTIPSSEELTFPEGFTLEAWVRPEETSGRASVIAKEASGSLAYQLLAKNQQKRPAAWLKGPKGEATTQANSSLGLDAWSHLTVTSNGTVMMLYVNGKAVNSASVGPPSAAEGPLQIGGDLLFEEDFKGKIDEVRLYNRILSEPEIKQDGKAPIVDPPAEPAPTDDDPAVDVVLEDDLVESVEGAEAGETEYGHEGELLTSVDGPEGETNYDYDTEGRMTKVTLPNGTWAEVAYREDGRVKSVTVQPAEGEEEATFFSYSDEPRRTTVTPEGAPAVVYDIGDDGSILQWQNVQKAPTIDDISGSIYLNRGKELPAGAQLLGVQAHSEEGVASIKVLASGTNLVDEKACDEDLETPEVECKTVESEWVMETENFTPGILNLEVLVEDRLGEMAAERFWVNIPQPPPPPPEGAPTRPKFSEIESFRDEFGLDVVDPVSSEKERNRRIFALIDAWTEGEPVARASRERWGVPLRAQDVAELEYREAYIAQAATTIPQWANAHAAASYAGYYVDHRAGGVIHVGFTNNQGSLVNELKNSEALMASNRTAGFPVSPANAQTSLWSILTSLPEKLESAPSVQSYISKAEVDVAGNRVRIHAIQTTPVGSFINAQYGSQAPVDIVNTAHKPHLRVRFRAGATKGGRLLAGDSIGGSDPWCTLGFGASERRGKKPNGDPNFLHFALTAGHCYNKDSMAHVFASASDHIPIGSLTRKVMAYPNGFNIDGAAIRLDEGFESPRWTYWSSMSQLRVTGAETTVPGSILCVSGSYYERSNCGIASEPFLAFPEDSFSWVVQTTAISTEGDSGGPVWNIQNYRAVGLVLGGYESTGPTWFTPLRSLTLPTDGSPQPTVPGLLEMLDANGGGPLNVAH